MGYGVNISNKEFVFSVACLSFVSLYKHYSNNYERIAMKFYGRVQVGNRNK